MHMSHIHAVLLRVQGPVTDAFLSPPPLPLLGGTLDPNCFPPGPSDDVSPGRSHSTQPQEEHCDI